MWQTLLGPSDREVVTGVLAAFLLDHMRAGIGPNGDGWIDDDRAFVTPWGFDLASIRVPVQLWQGEQDQFVPHGHGVWLAEHIPGIDARLSAEDGHLTPRQPPPETAAAFVCAQPVSRKSSRFRSQLRGRTDHWRKGARLV